MTEPETSALDRVERFLAVLEGESLTIRKADGDHRLMVEDVRELITELGEMGTITAEVDAEVEDAQRIAAELAALVEDMGRYVLDQREYEILQRLVNILEPDPVDEALTGAVQLQLEAMGVTDPEAAKVIMDTISRELAARQDDEVAVEDAPPVEDVAEDAPVKRLVPVNPDELPIPSANPRPHVPDVPASRFFGENTGQRYDSGDLNG